jgi:hypothetical protein
MAICAARGQNNPEGFRAAEIYAAAGSYAQEAYTHVRAAAS